MGTLKRLAGLRTGGHAALSVYLDLETCGDAIELATDKAPAA